MVIEFENIFFNSKEEITIKHGGNLPHWNQLGKVQFVTTRLADSLPQNRIEELKDAIEKFNQAYPQPWSSDTKRQYRRIIGKMEERLLDNGYGECVFRNPEVRAILSSAIAFYDEKKYKVLAYVIMPNHLHLLIIPATEVLATIMSSIKSYSSRHINKLLNRAGVFWMRESYDHIIRNKSELERCVDYIKANPSFLPQDEYEIYITPELQEIL